MGERMQFTELDQYLFGQATHYDLYKKLGAHPVSYGRQKGVYFAVWAPNAQYVSVIGEFNDWDTQANPMERPGLLAFSRFLCLEPERGSCISFILWGCMAKSFIRRIHMQMQPRCVLELPPVLQIFPHINGMTVYG